MITTTTHPLSIHPAPPRTTRIYAPGAALWQKFLLFVVGFTIQFNVLVGGSGGGAVATGGYGYRITDFIALGLFVLLILASISPHRGFSLGVFGLIVAGLFFLPIMSPDSRTKILAEHYALYSFAALYVAIMLSEASAISWFCSGLIIGMLATIPIFVLQASGYAYKLIEWGLTPGFSGYYRVGDFNILRYNGISSHPNEAGHLAALSAAAGAYFAFFRRRFLALVVVAGGLLIIFYYTRSRGGLIAGSLGIAIPFVLFARRYLEGWRFAVMLVVLAIGALMASGLGFVATRFGDPLEASNFTARIDSTLYGLHVLLNHPFGMSASEFFSVITSGTGGITSVHNGFIYFGGIFGLLPLICLLAVFLANLQFRKHEDIFFVVLVIQVGISFIFEQMSDVYSYAFIVCILGSRATLKTRIGAPFKAPFVRTAQQTRRAIRGLG
jgi:hypothetical protein